MKGTIDKKKQYYNSTKQENGLQFKRRQDISMVNI